jgi:glycosyltransferase involved in cell wall biosynthesis
MALSHGLPVITPDLPLTRTWASAGLPIVLARGSGGEALAEAICDIARDPAGQAAVSNRAHVWSLRNSARRAVSAAIDRLYQFEDGVQSAARVR